jgi:hypothetical protein
MGLNEQTEAASERLWRLSLLALVAWLTEYLQIGAPIGPA